MSESEIPLHLRPPGERQELIEKIFVAHDRYLQATTAIERVHMPVNGGTHGKGIVSVLAGDHILGRAWKRS